MRAIIQEIKQHAFGVELRVYVPEPLPPPQGETTNYKYEEECEEFTKALGNFQMLRIGAIEFVYAP